MTADFIRVPDGWEVRPLIECTSDGVVSYGIVQPGAHDEGGVPIVRVNNFDNNTLDTSSVLRVSHEVEAKYARTRLEGGEVLLTLVGSTGQSVVVPKSLAGWNVPRAIAVIRPADDVGAEWINICLQSSATAQYLDSRANTTVQKTLNLKDVKQIPVLLPPKEVKGFIESVAGSLNGKIELNRQINATLESMAQALFKSWFVDFDPVIDNALAAGNPIPEPLQARAEKRATLLAAASEADTRTASATDNAHPTQTAPHTQPGATAPATPLQPLPADLRALFPDSFVFNEEMGWVPEGWEVTPLSSLACLNPEAWSNSNHPHMVRYVDLANAKNGRINEVAEYLFDEAPSRARRVLKVGDTIFGTVRPGNRSFALIHEDGLTGSTGFAVLRPKENSARAFVYLATTQDCMIDVFAHLADGAAYPAIRSDVVAGSLVVIPGARLLEKFDEIAGNWLRSIGPRANQMSTLENLRDALLPKLLSGQIPISSVQNLAAEAM